MQTVTSGRLELTLHTVVQQTQPALATRAPLRASVGGARAAPAKAPPDFGVVRGASLVGTLARTPSAVDRVFQRLEERRRAEALAK